MWRLHQSGHIRKMTEIIYCHKKLDVINYDEKVHVRASWLQKDIKINSNDKVSLFQEPFWKITTYQYPIKANSLKSQIVELHSVEEAFVSLIHHRDYLLLTHFQNKYFHQVAYYNIHFCYLECCFFAAYLLPKFVTLLNT